MNKKLLNAIKFISVLLISISLVFSIIVSQDEHHLDTCHEDDCAICNIIHMAQIIINLSSAIILCIFIGFLIHFLLSISYKEEKVFVLKSLVFQKVQLNE